TPESRASLSSNHLHTCWLHASAYSCVLQVGSWNMLPDFPLEYSRHCALRHAKNGLDCALGLSTPNHLFCLRYLLIRPSAARALTPLPPHVCDIVGLGAQRKVIWIYA